MTPDAGTSNGLGNSKTISGLPICQPSKNCIGGGMSFGLPLGAPASTQAAIVSISFCVSAVAFENSPYCESANQGGIFFVLTASRIAAAQGRVCSYVNIEKGPASPGR